MTTIFKLSPNYRLSTDYHLLAKLARSDAIICALDYSDGCRDVAHTLYSPASHNEPELFQVSARGHGYIYAHGDGEFIKQCARANLGFLIP